MGGREILRTAFAEWLRKGGPITAIGPYKSNDKGWRGNPPGCGGQAGEAREKEANELRRTFCCDPHTLCGSGKECGTRCFRSWLYRKTNVVLCAQVVHFRRLFTDRRMGAPPAAAAQTTLKILYNMKYEAEGVIQNPNVYIP
jgi:hypothetical protein